MSEASRLLPVFLVAILLLGESSFTAVAEDYFPPPETGGGWRVADPASLGVVPSKLAEAVALHNGNQEYTRNYGGALLIICKGHVIAEHYVTGSMGGPQPWTAKTCNDMKSSTKSVFGTAAGVFLDEFKDKVTLDSLLVGTSKQTSLIPQIWDQPLTDPRKQRIQVKHCLSMTSGHTTQEPWNTPSARRRTPGFSGPCQMYEYCFGWWSFEKVPSQIKLLFEPGTNWNYSNFGLEQLALAMRNVSGELLGPYLYDRVLGPIGLPQEVRDSRYTDIPYENRNLMNFSTQPGWGVGGSSDCDAYGADRTSSPCGRNNLAGSTFRVTARDFARIAYLWLRKGRWKDRQLVPEKWLEIATRRYVRDDDTTPKEYGYTFWILDSWEGVPKDAFMSRGSDINDSYVIPSLDLVVVRQGNENRDNAARDAFRQTLIRKIVAAIPERQGRNQSELPLGLRWPAPVGRWNPCCRNELLPVCHTESPATPVLPAQRAPRAPVAPLPNRYQQTAHVWDMQEIGLTAARSYTNPYTEVDVWLDLKGPGFEKRVRGFWDEENAFKVRVVATAAGEWTWTSGSNQDDSGLNGKSGRFEAVAWTEQEKQANPNRRGFTRATPNGHALCYADGSPFFLFADTWWSASTRIWSWSSAAGDARISFQDAVQKRKAQGYNGIAVIASFPNWANDGLPNVITDNNRVRIRLHGWRTQDMVDEDGGRPFVMRGGRGSSADYDQIRPAYFQHLDRKMQYLSDQGFVPFFETVRRDHGESWKRYTPDWERSFARYVNYLIARYGCYNMLFSVLHLDTTHSIPIDAWKSAILVYCKTYGLPPFGQVVTALTDFRTDETWGHGPEVPWLHLHGVGNKGPRNNRYAQALYEQFMLEKPLPTLCQEGIYPGWGVQKNNMDDYPPRSMAWTCVLQGGLAGHVYGSLYFCGKDGVDGLTAAGSDKLPALKTFMLSEGAKYQELIPVRRLKSPDFEGSAVIARSGDARLVMAYFQRGATSETLTGLRPGRAYQARWFDPQTGKWSDVGAGTITPDASGAWKTPGFPNDDEKADIDWALRLSAVDAD